MWQELLALELPMDWAEHMELRDNIFRKFAIHNVAAFHNFWKPLHLGFPKIRLISYFSRAEQPRKIKKKIKNAGFV